MPYQTVGQQLPMPWLGSVIEAIGHNRSGSDGGRFDGAIRDRCTDGRRTLAVEQLELRPRLIDRLLRRWIRGRLIHAPLDVELEIGNTAPTGTTPLPCCGAIAPSKIKTDCRRSSYAVLRTHRHDAADRPAGKGARRRSQRIDAWNSAQWPMPHAKSANDKTAAKVNRTENSWCWPNGR